MRPLAVYIHWPFCKSKCPYCDFNSHVREQVDQQRWKEALLAELDFMASHVPQRTVSSIFFGGGTPSLMPPSTAEAVIRRVHDLWKTDERIEITLEANPTSVETNTFQDFRQAGFNRVSLGVQSLRAEELAFLGRQHNVGEALTAIDSARRIFDRYSFDLIYARPHQTPAAWESELQEALRYAGRHLSLYQLTIEENTAFHHAYAKGGFTLPDEEESETLYRLTESIMETHGMPAYEISNYAVPGEESRHNLAYWQGIDYIGVGPGAHGRLTLDTRIATQTLKSPERWLEATQKQRHGVEIWQPVEARQEAEERLMMGLRLREGIDYAGFEAQCGFDLRQWLNQEKVALYRKLGLLTDTAQRLQASLKGRLVLNRLTAELVA